MFDRKYQQLIQTLTNGRFIFNFKIQIDISYSRLIEIIQIKKTQQKDLIIIFMVSLRRN